MYIDRVSGAPCSDCMISLVKGAKADGEASFFDGQICCFLNGKNHEKVQLQNTKPELFKYFESIWAVRKRHMVPGLPKQYVFMLIACYDSSCIHPLCQKGEPESPHTWFENGPSVSMFPLPVKDPERPWGGQCQ